jgi:thiamine kinase-like enzyme
MSADARLAGVIAAVPALAGAVTGMEDIAGGLVNRSVKVTTAAGAFVVRLFATRSQLLPIDRDAEYASSLIAAEAGVGARVVAYLPELGAMVLEYIEGEAQTGEGLRSGDKPLRVARTLSRLHACRSFGRELDLFGSLREYRRIVDEAGFRLPDGYDAWAPKASAVEAALAAAPVALRPCHNDMMPANFIDDGGSLRLIDYEYAADNDPCFDLGGIWAEAEMTPGQLDLMVREYYGEPRPAQVARARLWAIVCDYGWMLWTAIQAGERQLADAWDPWEWGCERYARSVSAFESPDFEILVGSV